MDIRKRKKQTTKEEEMKINRRKGGKNATRKYEKKNMEERI
jgi:hypothetical protein